MTRIAVLIDQLQLTTRAADARLDASVERARRASHPRGFRFQPGDRVIDLVTGHEGEILGGRTYHRTSESA